MEPNEHQAVGARLRAARETLGLTQEDVAGALGIQRTSVIAMEAGKRNVSALELRRLARLYRRSVAWILGEEEEGDPLLSLGTVPNPSIGPPVFRVSLPEAGEVALSVFDMLGRLVGARDLGVLQEGVTQHQPFDFPSGLYFARMDTPGGSASCRFVVVRN